MAYAFVQAVKNSANSNSVSISPTAGNLVVFLSRTSAGGGTPTATGVQTNGSTALTQRVATFQNANGEWWSIFDLVNAPSGTTSITATYNGGTPGTCLILAIEYSGIATSSAFIVGSTGNFQNAPGTGANAITSGTATNVTSQPALVLGVVGNSGDSDTTAGTGYTNRFGNGTDNEWLVIDKRITATGNNQITATAATHGGTDNYETFLLSYAEPGGATVDPGVIINSASVLGNPFISLR